MDKNINPFELVEHFNHELVKVPKRKFPFSLNDEEFKWLRHCLHEEINELEVAHFDADFIGQVDALIDLIYFAMGGLTRLGVSSEQALEIFKCVHEKNMLKQAGNKGRGSDLDATKPEFWKGPEGRIKRVLYE